MFEVRHPLAGVPSPSLAELLERCDETARRTLGLAAAFCRRRLDDQASVDTIVSALERDPWGDRRPAWVPASAGIVASDLARALLALHADDLAALMFAPDRVDPSWAAMSAHWRAPADEIRGPADGVQLDPIWARRWALASLANASATIDRDGLVGMLPAPVLRNLATYCREYADGLVTADEAYHRCVDRLCAANVRCSIGSMPCAYWDRHGGFAELDTALASGPGAIVVGAQASGRHALISAWGARLRREGPPELRRFGFNIDNFHGGGAVQWKGEWVETFASVDSQCICVLSRFGSELDSVDVAAELRRFPDYCIDFAMDDANRFRLTIVTTWDELERREQQLPALRGFPRVVVPEIRDEEVLPLWICNAPAIEDETGVRHDVPTLLEGLAGRPRDRWRDFGDRSDLAGASTQTSGEADLEPFATAVRRGKWTDRAEQRLARYLASRPTLATLVGEPRRWPALVGLADELRGG